MSKTEILSRFELLRVGDAGIGTWLTPDTDPIVFDRLDAIASEPLTRVQLNQLFALSHEAPVTAGFFEYYWLTCPTSHPYDLKCIDDFNADWLSKGSIVSLDHLFWGLYRLYIDGLLYFGNVRTAFRALRSMSLDDLLRFFSQRRIDTDYLRTRGPALPLVKIPRDDRYLISEMACKSYGTDLESSDLKLALVQAYLQHSKRNGSRALVSDLIQEALLGKVFEGRQNEFRFSADDVLNETVESEEELLSKVSLVAAKFSIARDHALKNSRFYLSMVDDLDVYVATSMRTRDDFRRVASDCESIFSNPRLEAFNVRYFDPTLSAAAGHEDKGIIECLMVKCARALVYCAGERDSYGKDAEAAMALSQGKPVIFYCDHQARSRFYKEVHPLSRLIEFDSGVAVGAIVTDNLGDVPELLARVFNNSMQYELARQPGGNLRLLEKLTKSVVRLQTADALLAETFWNHYHSRERAKRRARNRLV